MTVYNINLGIGWASSGVEYAQAYRAKIFQELDKKPNLSLWILISGDTIEYVTSEDWFSR